MSKGGSSPGSVPAQAAEIADIPVVAIGPLRDGSPADRRAVAQRIGRACETSGFFYIVDHGVPRHLIDATFAQSRRFFARSWLDKLQSAATIDHWRGYVPAKLDREGGAMETFRVMLDLPPDDPDVQAGKPLHLPNRWPEHLPGFKEVVRGYFDAMMDLAGVLLPAFALALDLPEGFFGPMYRKPLVQLSLLHYRPPQSPAAADVEIGAGEHRDTGAFTIVMQDDVGGLEIDHRTRGWVAAPPIAGAFIVNVGDMMMRWTNGRFVSTPHRVVNRSARPRFSMPFFANPDFDVTVAPLAPFVAPDRPAQFEPIHSGTFMQAFYRQRMAYLYQPWRKASA